MGDKIFYKIPFHAKYLLEEKKLDKCDLADSIRQNLRLLLMTPPMRVRFDASYGCKLHWLQFLATNRLMDEDPNMEDNFKVKIEENISALIEKFEPRLQVVNPIEVHIRYSLEKQKKWLLLNNQNKKRNVLQIIVKIIGKVKPDYLHDDQAIDLEERIPLL